MELLLLLLSPDVLSFAGDVILFIDEVHILVEFGTAGRGNKGYNNCMCFVSCYN